MGPQVTNPWWSCYLLLSQQLVLRKKGVCVELCEQVFNVSKVPFLLILSICKRIGRLDGSG